MTRTSHVAMAALAAVTAVGLASCAGSGQAAEKTGTSTQSTTGFPVTVTVPGSQETLKVKEKPRSIAALSPDTSIALHELGLTDRLVAIPDSSTNTTLNPYADQMKSVKNIIKGGNDPDPEKVLSWNPDLVVVTSRHGGERDAAAGLKETGTPVLTLTNGWSTVSDVAANLRAIGKATGTEPQAKKLAKKITSGVAEVRSDAKKAQANAEQPSVAVVSNQGRVPFINAGSSLVSDLVDIAGGTNAAGAAGIKKTQPVQPEQLVAMNPDNIMLVDVTGKGRSSFDELLKNPAVANLPAVKQGKVKMFKGRDVYGLAGKEVVTGAEAIMTWLYSGSSGHAGHES